MGSAKESNLNRKQLAELSALADGTLDPERRPDVEAAIAASPELQALYERERQVVGALHSAALSDRAPAGLRARIEAERPSKRQRARRRTAYGGALAGALAAVALALALALPAGAPGSPSVSQAAALAARGVSLPAPVPDRSAPRVKLGQSVEEVYFPNWAGSLGWSAVGMRSDRLGGRPAVTVYYQSRGQRVAYTILGLPALAQPSAPIATVAGVELRTLAVDGRTVVTWRRAGHTCVLSGKGVTASELQKLASWKVSGLGD
jgi:anti-sigma factor RsiW